MQRRLLPPCLIALILLQISQFTHSQRLPIIQQRAVTDYAPFVNVECPDISTNPLIRQIDPEDQDLHRDEVAYVEARATTVLPTEWANWLSDGSALGYDLSAFEGNFPKVGIALPGGGLRAAQFGAACLNAIDSRNDTAKAAGTGGLLQVASYITGLSGGSWVTGSLLFNEWPNINDLVFGNNGLSGWMLDLSLVLPDGNNILTQANQDYFGSILWSVKAKGDAGIDTSLTDPWSRMISYHFLNHTSRGDFFTNDTSHGAGQLWSKIPELRVFKELQVPFPMIVANSRPSGSTSDGILELEAVVYEITPLEIGSYDPMLSAGMNLTYAGTRLNNMRPDNGSACVAGFDQAGFIMGTSASLFNQGLDFGRTAIGGFSQNDATGLSHIAGRQLRDIRTRGDDVANWPNPFQGIRSGLYHDSNATWLELLDGSSNQENIPYGPLFVKARGVDVVVVAEGSADIPGLNWPNGTAFITTKARHDSLLRVTHQKFPPIPTTAQDFIDTGLNARPAFFGCDPPQPIEYPIVISLPNAPPNDGSDSVANSPTFQLRYTIKHSRMLFDQIHRNLLSGFTSSADPDPEWGICLQCAAIDRARFKVTPEVPRSERCTACFRRYCYDPQSPPNKSQLPPKRKLAFVDPDPQGLDRLGSFLSRNKFGLVGGLIGLVAFIALFVFGLMWWKKRREQKYQAVRDQLDDNETLFLAPSSYGLDDFGTKK
ncbi:phospholipase B [Coprinopsis marcescibilis]|uniref:Lysophospholipase n=1 Tax=Coprinopsis marcescibilis TaxID=230819 RepID=A0A5C3KQZ3_COPMA|nr:phospholipase B [Coprinopsis marcescibilis]